VGAFVRRVKTASGATAVQIVHKRGRRVLGIEHIGSAHTDELALLLQLAEERRGIVKSCGWAVTGSPRRVAAVEDVAGLDEVCAVASQADAGGPDGIELVDRLP